MIKLFGCFIVMAASLLMGYISSQKFKMRVDFLNQYLNFIKYIETEITYSANIVYDLIKNYSGTKEIRLFIKFCCNNLENGETVHIAWHKALFEASKIYGLTNEDKKAIDAFGENFGKCDKNGQIAFCNINEDLINTQITSARKEKEEKVKLYFMLWLSLGAGVILMFI